jgi:hypothetical protein
MDVKLKRMKAKAKGYFRLDAFEDDPTRSIDSYIIDDFTPSVDLRPLITVVQEAMKKYPPPHKRSDSDSWLGPRLHATLRISRSDASDISIWDYLAYAVPELREYIVWRWLDEKKGVVSRDHLFGIRRHAFARLWWTAELMRNGPNYLPAENALNNQDMIDQFMGLNFFHSRPAALAFVRVMQSIDDDVKDKRQIIRKLSETFNHILTTLALDVVAPDRGPELHAYSMWMQGDVNEAILVAENPVGPNETIVDEKAIKNVEEILQNLLKDIMSAKK